MKRPSFSTWRPKRIALVLNSIGFALILIAAIHVFLNQKPTTEVKLNKATYHLTLADTEAERTQGLSGVEKLDSDGGLLMQFDTDGEWGIWMKDMKIPLDILWLNSDKQVVYIKEQVSPDLGTSVIMQPDTPSRYVLELSSGTVAKDSIKVGQQASFTIKEGAK